MKSCSNSVHFYHEKDGHNLLLLTKVDSIHVLSRTQSSCCSSGVFILMIAKEGLMQRVFDMCYCYSVVIEELRAFRN